MKKAIIYNPTRNLMQQGLAKKNVWKLVFVKEIDNKQEHLMGWTSSFETQSQIILEFNSKEDAINYATKKKLNFEVREPNASTLEKKDITFNFSKDRNLYNFSN
ncbi:MAG: ETC complex I subunit [Alphaproteobacteria bacterium]|jgi:dTDP-4-dehydrorhamnose reductase|nr:ETC complex I subunit [Alphaproteobacteria bacterium]